VLYVSLPRVGSFNQVLSLLAWEPKTARNIVFKENYIKYLVVILATFKIVKNRMSLNMLIIITHIYTYLYINKNVTVHLSLIENLQSSSPMALQFGHNVAVEYARVFIYLLYIYIYRCKNTLLRFYGQ
jgi:uncharacterized protein YueI